MLGAAHGQQGHDVASSKAVVDSCSIRAVHAVRLSAEVVELEGTVRQDPTTDREAAPRPYPFTLLRRRGSRFDGFVTRSK